MRILFTSLRNESHFQPLVPFIRACQGRGHEVAVAAPKELAARADKAGAQFFAVGHPGDEGLRPIWTRMRQEPEGRARQLVVREIFAGVCAADALPLVLDAVERFRPNLIVRESQEYAAVLASEIAGVPRARVSITQGSMDVDSYQLAADVLDAHRQAHPSAQGRSAPLDPNAERLLSEPALSLFPRVLEDEAAASRLNVQRFRAPRAQAPSPLPAWWGDDRRPLVYVTLGTVAGGMDVMQATYGSLLEALRDMPVRALLTVGAEFPIERLGTLPSNVHVERFVPQDDVFPHAAAVLHHGGSGTTLGVLAAGLPALIVPLFADQPENASAVQRVGAGLALEQRTANPERVRAALARVLADEAMRSAARRMASEIAALPPIEAAAIALEKLAD